MPGRWVKWFEGDRAADDDVARMHADARQVLDGADCALVKRLRVWLHKQANAPSKIGDHMEMIVAATRCNTMREVVERIDTEIANAKAVVESASED